MNYRHTLAIISILFFFFGFFGFFGKGAAYGENPRHILSQQTLTGLSQQFLAEHRSHEFFTALSIAVRQFKNHQALNVNIGTLGTKDMHLITDGNLFQIGSLTKSFIAALLLQLEADPLYQLRLDDPLTLWLPEYPKWHDVTLRMLLNMTSGIPDHFKLARNYNHYLAQPLRKHARREWIDAAYQESLLFSPGTQFSYSNTNYILLGMIIERVIGMPLEKIMQTRLLTPLQLHSTYYTDKLPPKLQNRLIRGYQGEQGYAREIPHGTDVSLYNLSYLDAAGSLFATNTDVARWFQALFTPGPILNKAQIATLVTPYAEGYALGVNVRYSNVFHEKFYVYEGMTLGYRALYIYIPAKDLFISILVNSSYDGANNHLYALANTIAEKYLGIT